MALQVPQMALALDILNANFARPGGADEDDALGWIRSGSNLSPNGIHGDSPRPGHPRCQKYTLGASSDSETVLSSRGSVGHLHRSAEVSSWIVYKTDANVGGAGNEHIDIIMEFLEEDGTGAIYDTINTINVAATDWTFLTVSNNVTAGGNSHHARCGIRMERDSGSTTFSIWLAFLDVGSWKEDIAAAGAGEAKSKYTWQQRPNLMSSFSTPSVRRPRARLNSHGEDRQIVNDRYAERWLTQLGISICDDDMAEALRYAWQMNKGTNHDGTGDITGGAWPIVLFTGSTDLYGWGLQCGLYDFDGNAFPLRPPSRLGWQPHPPYWSGNLRAIERI